MPDVAAAALCDGGPGSLHAQRNGSRTTYPRSFCAGLRQVNQEFPLHWAAVVDAHDNTRAVRSIDDTDARPEREGAMARRQSGGISNLAVRGAASQPIPNRNAVLLRTRCCISSSSGPDQRPLAYEVIELAPNWITVHHLSPSCFPRTFHRLVRSPRVLQLTGLRGRAEYAWPRLCFCWLG